MAEDFQAAASKLLQAFLYVDVTRDSYIQMDELKPLMNSMGLDLDDNGIQEIINLFDDNGDGEMDMIEFIEFFTYMAKMVAKKDKKSYYMKYMHDDYKGN